MTDDADLIQARLKVNTEIAEFPDALSDWLRSRTRNCRNLATIRSGNDRRGWLEDAAYFEALRVQVTRITELEAEITGLKADKDKLLDTIVHHCQLTDVAYAAEADMRERAAKVCGAAAAAYQFTRHTLQREAAMQCQNLVRELPLSTGAAPAHDKIAEKAQ